MSPFEFRPRRPIVAQVTVAASTAQASPAVTNVALGPNVVIERMRIKIPPGHAALTGIALRYGGKHVLPYADGTYIVGDGDEIAFDLGFPVWGTNVQVATFNTDRIAHTFYLTFELSDMELASVGTVAPLSFEAIESAVIL